MRTTEQNTKMPSATTGFFAMLCGSLSTTGTIAPSRAPRVLVLLIALAGVMAFSSAPALAKKVYVSGVSFGGEGSGNGQFKEPVGVAVNEETGDVYVVDKGNARVEYFNSAGVYEGQFNGGASPAKGLSSPEQIAVDNDPLSPSHGDVYLTDDGHDVIDKFSSTGAYLGQLTETVSATGEGTVSNCVIEGVTTTTGEFSVGQEISGDGIRPGTLITQVEDGGSVINIPYCLPAGSKLSLTARGYFGVLRGVAVDQDGNLWVYEHGEAQNAFEGGPSLVAEFSDTGEFARVWSTSSEAIGVQGLAVDSSDNIYLVDGEFPDHAGAEKFTGAGNNLHVGYGVASALAISASTNNLFVDEIGSIAMYGPFGEPSSAPLETFAIEGALSDSHGIAVDGTSADQTVYASERGADMVNSFLFLPEPTVLTETPSNVSETAMTLKGTVNPEGEPVSECYFEYGTEPGKYTSRVACEQEPKALVGTAAIPVSATLAGLPSSGVRSVRLVAANANGTTKAVGVTISRPTTTGESLSNVSVIAATLSAQVDPGGLVTSYHLEYGTSTAYGASTPEEDIGSANQSVGVRVILTGLQPGTQYHWRVVARNALGTVDGPDVTFATYAPVAGLPDGRVYEPVGPVASSQDVNIYIPNANVELSGFNEHGIPASSLLPFQAAAGGEAVVYAGDPPPTGGTSAGGESFGNEYLATRSPGGGWTQVALETSSQNETAPTGSHEHAEYRAFTGDLSVGILEGPNIPVTGAPLEYQGLYAHTMAGGVDGEYESLLTTVPDRPEKELYTEGGKGVEQAPYAGANAGTATVRAYSHLLFASNADLLEGEGQLEKEVREDVGKEVATGQYSEFTHYLYDNVGGKLYLIDVLPNGGVAPGGAFGSIEEALTNGGEPGGGPGFTHVISADGSRVFWTYAPEASSGTGKYEGLVLHRSRALYVRENDTRPQSPVGPEEECLVAADACTVQVDAAVGGEGIFQDASADGSKVFFTKGDLYEYDLEDGETTDLSPGVTVKGVAGIGDNGEYVYYVDSNNDIVLWHAGVTTLVAAGAANSSDYSVYGTASDYAEEIGSRTAEVTPDGQSLVFMSNTGVEQVFLYEAGSSAHPPKLTCISCDPTGEAPVPTNASAGPSNHSVGGVLPRSVQATYQPRWISEDGSRVFFESAQPLVAQATNGWLDVYEWERDGTGSCQLSQGCIFLLSSGSDPENSYLLDASADGDDVFIITRAELVAQDRNDLDDVYDVRVGGVRPGVAPACSGTGCQGVPPAPPIFATPASVTFEGVGNFAAPPAANHSGSSGKSARCRSGFVKRNGRCVKKRSAKRAKKRRAKRATGPAKKMGRSSGHSKGRI